VVQSQWVEWLDTVPEFHASSKQSFADIIVPTKDSVRYKFIMSTLITVRLL
jgi:dynein heavy chain